MYRWLLRLLPRHRRATFGAEMERDFSASVTAARTRSGRLGLVRAWLREIVGLVRFALRERLLAVTADMPSDLRQGLRVMRRSPWFTLTAACVLSLGIGVNTALFSVINALFFAPLRVADPSNLFYIYSKNEAGQVMATVDPSWFEVLAARSAPLAELTTHWRVRHRVTTDGLTEQVYGEYVDDNYFDVLGVGVERGRALRRGDNATTTSDVPVVVSHDYWARRMNGRRDIIGLPIRIGEVQATIAGVAPPGFSGLTDPWTPSEYWVPGLKMAHATLGRPSQYTRYSGGPIGRLRPGVSHTQFQAFFDALVPEWRAERLDRARTMTKTPADFERVRRSILAGSWPLYRAEDVRLPFNPVGRVIPLGLLVGMVAVVVLVLIIAAINIAGMLLARGVTRTGEVAVRRALGADAGRLTRQMVTESLLLSLSAAGLGFAIAEGLVQVFRSVTPNVLAVTVTLDWRVLGFAIATCLGTGLIVGLAPALQARRVNVLEALGNGATSARVIRAHVRQWILVPQISVTMVLLLVAGVHTRNLLQIERTHPGYTIDGTTVMTVGRWEPRSRGRSTAEEQERAATRSRQFMREVLARVEAVPQVTRAALASTLTVAPTSFGVESVVTYQDYVGNAAPRGAAIRTQVSDGYFDVMGMQVRAGRLFDDRDGVYEQFGTRVAIVSERLARAVWPAGNAVGQTFTLVGDAPGTKVEWFDVVGVVSDVEAVLSDREHQPRVYFPLKQQWFADAPHLLVRGQGERDVLIQDVKAAVVGADPYAEVAQVRTLEQVVAEVLYPRRLAAGLLIAAGLIGLLLSALGLYGVISYSVEQRRRELGIRATLGADQRDIVFLVLREGGRLAAVGTLVGLVAAVIVLHLTASLLPQVPTWDWVSAVAVPALLALVVTAACLIPARRAARVDPSAELRA